MFFLFGKTLPHILHIYTSVQPTGSPIKISTKRGLRRFFASGVHPWLSGGPYLFARGLGQGRGEFGPPGEDDGPPIPLRRAWRPSGGLPISVFGESIEEPSFQSRLVGVAHIATSAWLGNSNSFRSIWPTCCRFACVPIAGVCHFGVVGQDEDPLPPVRRPDIRCTAEERAFDSITQS